MNIRLLILTSLLQLGFTLFCKSKHYRWNFKHSLIMPDKKFQNPDFCVLRSFLEQTDDWSCGLRVILHALAIEKASKKAHEFEDSLKTNLGNEQLLFSLEKYYLTNLLPEDGDPGVTTDGLTAMAKCNNIGDRFIVLDLHRNQIIDDETDYVDEKLENKINKMIKKAKRINKPVYFAAIDDEHWVLFSITFKPVSKLYVIDSENYGITRNIKKYVNYLMPYLNDAIINSKLKTNKFAIKQNWENCMPI